MPSQGHTSTPPHPPSFGEDATEDFNPSTTRRLRITLLVAALVLGGVTLVAWPEEFDRRMAESCKGLATLDGIYPSGDRDAIDSALEQSMAVTTGVELLNEADSKQSVQDLSSVARAAYAFDFAALGLAKSNESEPQWRGEALSGERRQTVETALRICERY